MIIPNYKVLWLLSVFLTLSLLLAACGDDEPAPAAVDGAATPTAVVEQEPAAPADTPVSAEEDVEEPTETDTLTETDILTEAVDAAGATDITGTAETATDTLITQDVEVITGTQLITGMEITTDVIVTTETVVLEQQLITTVITATDIVTDVTQMTDQETETESELITETVQLTPETGAGAAAVEIEITPATPTPSPTVVVRVTEVVTDTEIVTETVEITATATPPAGRTPTPAAGQTVTDTEAAAVAVVFVGIEGAAENQLRASTLLGYNFENVNGEVSGEIEDLLVDITNGRVVYALLEYGGILDIGDTQVAAPLSAFAWGADGELVLNFEESQLENLPELGSDWPNFGDASWDDALSDFWQELGFDTGPEIEEVSNNIVRASDLMGHPVSDMGFGAGTLEDMIVSLGEGRVKYLLLSFADATEFGNEWVAVPFSAFDATIADGQLTFTTEFDPTVLDQSPRINPNVLGQDGVLDPTVDEVLTDYWEGAGYPTTVDNQGQQNNGN